MHSPSVVVFCQKPANPLGSPLSRWLAPTPGQNYFGTIWRDVPSSSTVLTRSTDTSNYLLLCERQRKLSSNFFLRLKLLPHYPADFVCGFVGVCVSYTHEHGNTAELDMLKIMGVTTVNKRLVNGFKHLVVGPAMLNCAGKEMRERDNATAFLGFVQ